MQTPSIEQLAEISRADGLGLSVADLDTYRTHIGGLLASFDAVEQLHRAHRVLPPLGRKYSGPDDNPLGAWRFRTRVTSSQNGPLAGRTAVVKDNIAVAGVPLTAGSGMLEGYVPAEDATVVRRLLDAGAHIVGTATCEGLCHSGGSHTSSTGPVRNPWHRDFSTGGSSSGCAALVAAGEADIAIGGDLGGSVRIPAAWCGVVGHKPTHGLIPCTGAFPMENTLDHMGVLARTVQNTARAVAALAGPDGCDPRQNSARPAPPVLESLNEGVRGMRIGVLAEGFGLPESQPGVDAAVGRAVDALVDAGAVRHEVSVPWHRPALDVWAVLAIEGSVWQMIKGNGYGRNWQGRYDPDLIAYFARGRRDHAGTLPETVVLAILTAGYTLGHCAGRHYAMAQNLRPRIARAYETQLQEVDVLLLPTVPYVATPLPTPDTSLDERIQCGTGMVANTAPFNASGHPVCAVPVGDVAGLPASMSIVAASGRDDMCLRVARAYERQVGGFASPPLTPCPDRLRGGT